MNKSEIVSELSSRTGVPKAKVALVINEYNKMMAASLSGSGEELRISGVGVFGTALRNERVYRNPRTGDSKSIPAHLVPKIKVSAVVRTAAAESVV